MRIIVVIADHIQLPHVSLTLLSSQHVSIWTFQLHFHRQSRGTSSLIVLAIYPPNFVEDSAQCVWAGGVKVDGPFNNLIK